MDKFVKEVTLDPKEIPNMTLDQKQDCMAEVDKRRKQAWLFSVFFSLGVIVFILIYSIISVVFTLKYHSLPVAVDKLLIIIPAFIFIPAFFAHNMNSKCVMWTFFAYVIVGCYCIFTGQLINAWISPFAFAGMGLYIRMSRICDTYYALEKEDGFPEFCDIEVNAAAAKAVLQKKEEKGESLNFLTDAAIMAAKANTAEKKPTDNSDD